jgi:hypothetical protein
MRYSLIILTILLMNVNLSADIQITQKNERTYLIHFNNDNFTYVQTDKFTAIHLPEAIFPVEAGAPNLPYFEIHLAVPPNAEIELNILTRQSKSDMLANPIEPVYTIIPENKTHQFLQIINEAEYQNGQKEMLEKSERQYMRHTPYFTIRIHPFLYEHSSKQLLSVSNLSFEIKIIGDTRYLNSFHDPFSATLASFFINPEQADRWKHIKPAEHAKIPFESSQFWYKIELNRNIDQKISQTDLAKLPTFVTLSQLQLLSLINSEKTHFELINIPYHIENGELFFSFPSLENIPNQAWLTFGRISAEPSLSIQPVKLHQLYQNVLSLTEYSYQKKTKNEVDCLLISPQVFLPLTQELADFYLSFHNLTSVVMDQQEIVDTYAGGLANPIAIKNYIQSMYAQSPGLKYVVLVGSGTERGNSGINLQEWYALTSKNKMLVYANRDDNFVSINSTIPTLPIARIPAKTIPELQMYIARTKQFTEYPNVGFWQNKLLLIADDENKSGGYEGFGFSGMNHSRFIEETANLLNDSIVIEKIFAFHYEMNGFNQKPGVTNDIIKSVNEGVLTWVYVGHGNHNVMGDEDYFIGTQHVKNLENSNKLNLMIAASCSVGQFSSDTFDCIAEQLLLSDKGGCIATIAASEACEPNGNILLTKKILTNLYHLRFSGGFALWNAKLTSGANMNNSKLFHFFGDPLLPVNPPEKVGTVTITQPVESPLLQARQTVLADGNFNLPSPMSKTGDIRVYDTAVQKVYYNFNYTYQDTFYTVHYWDYGKEFYRGYMQIENNAYQFGFIVPDDIHSGNKGRIINYAQWQNTHYINTLIPVSYSNVPIDVQSNDKPQVTIWLDSEQFQPGDYVSTNPTVLAKISDENGINIIGEPGRKILIHLDKSNSEDDLFDATNSFNYETGSYTQGMLEYSLPEISIGHHTLDLYVYDNFGDFTIAYTHFYAQKTGKITIKDMLPYPNPMKDNGKFTFVITEAADVTLQIFTITGKKIREIKQFGLPANYNEIAWNGKDEDGDKLANNTYFYKLKATSLQNRKTTEKIGKFIIYK